MHTLIPSYPQHMHTLITSAYAYAYAYAEHAHKELMCALSIRIRNMCALSTYALGTYAICMHWAHTSRTYVCIEHTHQVLMHVLSICVRNLCVCWENSSVSYAHVQCSLFSMSVKIPNLKRALENILSIHVRNSYVHWMLPAYKSLRPAPFKTTGTLLVKHHFRII